MSMRPAFRTVRERGVSMSSTGEIALGTNGGHDDRNLPGRFAVKAGYGRVGENYMEPTARTPVTTNDKE